MMVVVAGIFVLTFVLAHLAPGDPARDFAGEGADASQIEAAEVYLGLDRPLPEQFVVYVGRVVTGDLGTSYVQRQPVTTVIRLRLPPTLLLMGSALAVSSLAGVVLGLSTARRPKSASAKATSTLTMLAYSLPGFWLGQLMVITFAIRAGILPAGGMNDAREAYTGLAAVVDTARHLMLPVFVLALSETALLARVTGSAVRRQVGANYMRTAAAKGLGRDEAFARHALPNALLPVVTVIGGRLGFLVSGAVLIESVFAWPGLGRLLVEASRSNDHPVILGMVLMVSFAVVGATLLTDLVYSRVDPRIRFR